jgi:hypothetical protein
VLHSPGSLLPYPAFKRNLGRRLCAPSFRMVCLFQAASYRPMKHLAPCIETVLLQPETKYYITATAVGKASLDAMQHPRYTDLSLPVMNPKGLSTCIQKRCQLLLLGLLLELKGLSLLEDLWQAIYEWFSLRVR